MSESFLPRIAFTDITDAALVFDALCAASDNPAFVDQRSQLLELRQHIAVEIYRLRDIKRANSSTESE